MRTGRPKADLVLSSEERQQLQSFARSRSLPAALSNRARIILSSAEGELNSSIAARLELTKATVGKWRLRFIERRVAGLYDDVRPGKPRTIDDERVAQLIKTTLHTKPADGSTHWSVRTVAAETGISKTSVQRYFQLFGLQPHRSETFKLSNDPFFVEKLRDIVGLYLSPPDNALVICVDEKSQCQALERTQPMLPMGWGYVEGVTHDYKRHGTTTLFAALNVLNGAVLSSCKPRHRHQEFLSFLREIDNAVERWFDSGARAHAQAVADLNILAFALVMTQQTRRAEAVFQRLGQYMTNFPWCTGNDPLGTFTYWQRRARRS